MIWNACTNKVFYSFLGHQTNYSLETDRPSHRKKFDLESTLDKTVESVNDFEIKYDEVKQSFLALQVWTFNV